MSHARITTTVRYATGIAVAILWAWVGCANKVADGGSEAGNARIIGEVVSAGGTLVQGAIVQLIPAQFDPVKDTESFRIDTTDNEGRFEFANLDSGCFTLRAKSRAGAQSALKTSVSVNRDTVDVPPMMLQAPGTIKVMLPDEADAAEGYVYIPGTDIFVHILGSADWVILDSVPSGGAPSIAYSSASSVTATVIRHEIPIISGDTAIIYNPQWQHAKRLYLNTTPSGADVAGNVENFPILIRLTSSEFNFSQARSNGADIRFTKLDNTFLPYEIERWDAVNHEADIWVKADAVFGNDSTQCIVMYWSNANAIDNSNGAGVFDTVDNVIAAWHLNQNCNNAASNKYNGIASSASDTVGLIGDCKKFNGSDSIVIAGLLGSPSSITLSAWAQLDTTLLAGGSDILSLGDAALIRMDCALDSLGTDGIIHLSDNTVFLNVFSGRFLKQTGWHLITFTMDETTFIPTLYIDGVIAGSRSDLNTPINYSGIGQNTYIGKHGNGKDGYFFSGRIDEVRVYTSAKTADYIKLSYMNQKENDALVVFK